MKLLIWLLAMYVLVLTGLPCPDSDCHDHAVSFSSVPVSHDDEQHEAPCSPFCHCATCATCVGFTVPQPLVNTLPPQTSFVLLDQSVFAYEPIWHEDVIDSIWQPPKL